VRYRTHEIDRRGKKADRETNNLQRECVNSSSPLAVIPSRQAKLDSRTSLSGSETPKPLMSLSSVLKLEIRDFDSVFD
jgi:hypothetical protein